jgi:hypothetical protein
VSRNLPRRIGAVTLGALVLVAVLVAALVVLTDRSAGAADGGACETVVVSVDWDRSRAETVTGVVVRVRFPRGLSLPVNGATGSAQERVEVLSGTDGGLFDAIPRDGDGDGVADVINVGLIRKGSAPGPFAKIRFDCAAGTASRKASDFSCTSDVADETGSVPSSCRVAIAGG